MRFQLALKHRVFLEKTAIVCVHLGETFFERCQSIAQICLRVPCDRECHLGCRLRFDSAMKLGHQRGGTDTAEVQGIER